MFRLPEEFLPDLQSDDPERVLAGVEELHFLTESLDSSEIPRWDLDHVLRVLGGRIDTTMLEKLQRVIEGYDGFVPPLSPVEKVESLWKLTRTTHDYAGAFATNLFVKCNPETLPELLRILRETLPPDGGEALLDHVRVFELMLDAKPSFRAKLLESLTDPAYEELRAELAPALEEWARIDAYWREHPDEAPE